MIDTEPETAPPQAPGVRIGSRRMPLPRSRLARTSIGVLLVLGGLLGFLPVLGFWMVPLGVVVLAYDFPPARRLSRRVAVRWGRWRGRTGAAARNGGADEGAATKKGGP